MAKGNLFLSQARGKVGSVVFYRQDGEQVTRVYTNQVSNPRTAAQNLQRAIFYTVQRYAAGAKYIIEQGQENVSKKRIVRQAFLKQALKRLRSAYESGENLVLNVKGNPYLQPAPISLTSGTLPQVNYGYFQVEGDDTEYYPSLTALWNEDKTKMTLRELFSLVPSFGLGKQITIVWLEQSYVANEDFGTANINGLNYRTELCYSEIVFTDNEALLDAPAFVDDNINPAVLAPSWGGNRPFPTVTNLGSFQPVNGNRMLSFAVIVSDFTNNVWSRSTADFSVNPVVNIDNYAVTETYGTAATDSSASDLYLDQAITDVENGATERTAQAVISYITGGATATQSVVLTDNQPSTTFEVPTGALNIKLSILGTKLAGDANASLTSRMSGGTVENPVVGGSLSVRNSSSRYQINGDVSADAPAGTYNNLWTVRHADYTPGNGSTFTEYRVAITIPAQG